jgi:hypothetical protein
MGSNDNGGNGTVLSKAKGSGEGSCTELQSSGTGERCGGGEWAGNGVKRIALGVIPVKVFSLSGYCFIKQLLGIETHVRHGCNGPS